MKKFLCCKRSYLLLPLLSVGVLLPLDKDGVDEEEVGHVGGQEADDAEDHDDHELDDGGVPLLVATHAPRTESLREADTRRGPGVHGEAGDDDILTVAVTEMSG